MDRRLTVQALRQCEPERATRSRAQGKQFAVCRSAGRRAICTRWLSLSERNDASARPCSATVAVVTAVARLVTPALFKKSLRLTVMG